MQWALLAKRLYDGTGGAVVEDGVVVVEDGRIAAAGPRSRVAVPPGAQVVDVGNRTILPGLIDAHVHMLTTGSAASSREAREATPSQLLLTGVQNAQLALRSGLTTVRDCGDYNFLSLELRDAIARGVVQGSRIVASGPCITTTAGQLWWWGIEADTNDELRKAVRTLVKRGVDFVKLMASGGNATPGSNPEVSQYPPSAYQTVVDDAHRMGRKVAAHVHGVEAIRMAVDAGVDTLEHCPFRARGTIVYDERVAEDIVRKGLIVSLAMPATWYRMRAEEMQEARTHPGHLWEGRYDTIRRLHAAGVKLVVSSDQGSTGTRIDELPLLMEFLVERLELPAGDVLRGVTGLAAEALGLEDRLGTLAPGKVADVVVVDGNPLVDIRAVRNVHLVVKEGRVVVRDGHLAA